MTATARRIADGTAMKVAGTIAGTIVRGFLVSPAATTMLTPVSALAGPGLISIRPTTTDVP